MAIVTSIIFTAILCSTAVSGDCPVKEGRAQEPLVLRLQTNTDGPSDAERSVIINYYLENAQHGTSTGNLTITCKQIAELNPHYTSGYYWIQGEGGSGAIVVYCEMSEMSGNNTCGESRGWMRIANVDMRNEYSQCPSGLFFSEIEGRRLCVSSSETFCTSTTFTTRGVNYSRVYGRVIGYQYDYPNGFGPSTYTSTDIDRPYVDGVSITHGSPRQHVWTLAAAQDEVYEDDHYACPCLHQSQNFRGIIPNYVGEDYYCETGSREKFELRYYFDDPLWDGEGCEGENECCDRGGPWF